MIAKGEWQDTNFVFTYINRDKMFQNLFLTDLSLSFLFLFIQLTDVRYFFILNIILDMLIYDLIYSDSFN